MRPIAAGLIALVLTLLADQASKLYFLFVYDLPLHDPLELGPFVTFTVVWNKGISYGLFQQGTEFGRWALVAIALVSTVALGVWMARATNRLLTVSLGLILGGAIGNAIDRIAYGAVFDFVHLHVGEWSWYVFNVADAAIVFGVVGLIWDAFVASRQQSRAV
jgi:signal peptidase II